MEELAEDVITAELGGSAGRPLRDSIVGESVDWVDAIACTMRPEAWMLVLLDNGSDCGEVK